MALTKSYITPRSESQYGEGLSGPVICHPDEYGHPMRVKMLHAGEQTWIKKSNDYIRPGELLYYNTESGTVSPSHYSDYDLVIEPSFDQSQFMAVEAAAKAETWVMCQYIGGPPVGIVMPEPEWKVYQAPLYYSQAEYIAAFDFLPPYLTRNTLWKRLWAWMKPAKKVKKKRKIEFVSQDWWKEKSIREMQQETGRSAKSIVEDRKWGSWYQGKTPSVGASHYMAAMQHAFPKPETPSVSLQYADSLHTGAVKNGIIWRHDENEPKLEMIMNEDKLYIRQPGGEWNVEEQEKSEGWLSDPYNTYPIRRKIQRGEKITSEEENLLVKDNEYHYPKVEIPKPLTESTIEAIIKDTQRGVFSRGVVMDVKPKKEIKDYIDELDDQFANWDSKESNDIKSTRASLPGFKGLQEIICENCGTPITHTSGICPHCHQDWHHGGF